VSLNENESSQPNEKQNQPNEEIEIQVMDDNKEGDFEAEHEVKADFEKIENEKENENHIYNTEIRKSNYDYQQVKEVNTDRNSK